MNKIHTECHKCGHIWEYKGAAVRATCPSCGSKIYVEIEDE